MWPDNVWRCSNINSVSYRRTSNILFSIILIRLFFLSFYLSILLWCVQQNIFNISKSYRMRTHFLSFFFLFKWISFCCAHQFLIHNPFDCHVRASAYNRFYALNFFFALKQNINMRRYEQHSETHLFLFTKIRIK